MISLSLLEKALGGFAQKHVALAGRTSIRIGGKVEYWVEPSNEQSLIQVVDLCVQSSTSYCVLGAGTNVLASDEVTTELVIHLPSQLFRGEKMDHRNLHCCEVTLGAGEPLSKLCNYAQRYGCMQTEALWGIPGTVGGAIKMNAGTKEGSIANFCVEVGICRPGKQHILSASEIGFSYRSSRLPKGSVISWAKFRLPLGNPEQITKSRQAVLDAAAKRMRTQPLQWPNFGSVFKNPPGKSAGQLVEACGLKGERLGGAQISQLHANFIINRGDAKSIDVLRLMRKMQDAVLDKFDVLMIPEVMFLGESDSSLAPREMVTMERMGL